MRNIPDIRATLAQRLADLRSNRIGRASLWTFFGFVASQGIRIGSNLLLTRLVAPDAFGLMAIVIVVLIGMEMLTDVGLTTVVVRSKRGEDAAFVNTAWVLKCFRGVLIGGTIAILAQPLASLYAEPSLAPVLMVLALSPIIAGLSSNAADIASRRLWLGRTTVASLLSQVASLSVTLVWALHSPTVWALVAGALTGSTVTSLLSHLLFRQWRNRLAWDWPSAVEILTYAKWIFATSALVFLSGQIDRLVLAHFATLKEVGLYSIALMWASGPLMASQVWATKIILPVAAELLRQEYPDTARLRKHRRFMILTFVPGLGVFGVVFSPAFQYLYTAEYWGVIDYFPIFVVGAAIRTWEESYRVFCLASSRVQFTLIGAFLTLVTFLALILPLHAQLGSVGIALAYAIAPAGGLLATTIGVYRMGVLDLRFDAAVLVLFALIMALSPVAL